VEEKVASHRTSQVTVLLLASCQQANHHLCPSQPVSTLQLPDSQWSTPSLAHPSAKAWGQHGAKTARETLWELREVEKALREERA